MQLNYGHRCASHFLQSNLLPPMDVVKSLSVHQIMLLSFQQSAKNKKPELYT